MTSAQGDASRTAPECDGVKGTPAFASLRLDTLFFACAATDASLTRIVRAHTPICMTVSKERNFVQGVCGFRSFDAGCSCGTFAFRMTDRVRDAAKWLAFVSLLYQKSREKNHPHLVPDLVLFRGEIPFTSPRKFAAINHPEGVAVLDSRFRRLHDNIFKGIVQAILFLKSKNQKNT